jgi:hypothetical protein
MKWINVTQGSEEAVGYDKRLKNVIVANYINFFALCSVLCMYTFLFGDSELCFRKEMYAQKLWTFVYISMVVKLKGLCLGTVFWCIFISTEVRRLFIFLKFCCNILYYLCLFCVTQFPDGYYGCVCYDDDNGLNVNNCPARCDCIEFYYIFANGSTCFG